MCTKTPLELKLRSRERGKTEDYATIRHRDMPEGELKTITIEQVTQEIREISE